jgi:hypothetical protein
MVTPASAEQLHVVEWEVVTDLLFSVKPRMKNQHDEIISVTSSEVSVRIAVFVHIAAL